MLMQLRTNSFLERGADISWLSAFPAESECLYCPMVYLQVEEVSEQVIRIPSGNSVTFTVVRVVPHEGHPCIG